MSPRLRRTPRDDNVYIGGVPITGETGSGAHYGIGLEIWGSGQHRKQ